eukprot:7306223-Alexandrium_andersonii.AAC.1
MLATQVRVGIAQRTCTQGAPEHGNYFIRVGACWHRNTHVGDALTTPSCWIQSLTQDSQSAML